MTTQDRRVRYAMDHPADSQASIARQFKISRERIRQIFDQAGYRHPPFTRTVQRETRTCAQFGCSRQFLARPKQRLANCPEHRAADISKPEGVEIRPTSSNSCGWSGMCR